MATVANHVVAALERARLSLLVAFLVIAPAIALTAGESVLATAPVCEASLRRADYAPLVRVAEAPAERVALGTPLAQSKGGSSSPHEYVGPLMWIEQELDKDPQGAAVIGASLVLHANDASGLIECGSVRLDTRGVGSRGGALEPRASGDYVYFDTRYADASQDAVRVVIGPQRHVQTARIFSRTNLPLAVTLLSAIAFVVALLRVRRAGLYAERVRYWQQADLREGGRVENGHGITLGVFASAEQALEPGPVLVAPEGILPRSSYRDVPILPRRFGAHGTHAEWAAATLDRLRAAHLLTILAACSALCGVAARALG